MKYEVVKNFQDKYTKEYYGIGFTYETEDTNRAEELERGGFIVLEGSEAAKMATTVEATTKDNEEAYTIVDGKKVSLNQAQAKQEAAETNTKATGVTKNHDNHSEAVEAGKTAQNQQNTQTKQAAKQQENAAEVNVKRGKSK